MLHYWIAILLSLFQGTTKGSYFTDTTPVSIEARQDNSESDSSEGSSSEETGQEGEIEPNGK